MSMKVTDEMLMAYVDGELDKATEDVVRRATAHDPALARRADSFRISRSRAREVLTAIHAEPLPDRLIAAALGSANMNVAPARRRWTGRVALPLAASIALAGFSGYWIALQSTPGSGDLFGGRAVAEALGETSSGSERTVRTAFGDVRLRIVGSYRVENGLCRSYALSRGTGINVQGVGCNRGQGWSVEVAVAAGSNRAITPASSAAPAALDAFLDALGAEGPLSAKEEAAFLTRRSN